MKKLFLIPFVLLAFACSSPGPAPTATTASEPAPPLPTTSVVSTYIPATPPPPSTPRPPSTSTPDTGLQAQLATVSAEATAAAREIARLMAATPQTIVLPTPLPVVIVQELMAEELLELVCFEYISSLGREHPGNEAGVKIVHEGIYWVAFDCNRFLE